MTGVPRTYRRPVPTIGDATSARQRAQQPDAWAFPPEDRDALHRIIAARRDIRRFRPDPVPAHTLTRILEAAHAAPSVGHSQPWRFVVVEQDATRERAALLADRARLAQAAQLDPESARRLLDLQLEGLREAPLGIVVCCDRRAPAGGVLGRATFPDTDVWSCAAAIENLWLAARAEGLGLGWVTLFEPADLADLLGLPDGVVTLGWLCLGWPDERPPSPGLERAGWSRKAPLSDVVLAEHWPVDAPAAPTSRLRAPGQRAVVGARDEADRLLTPPGSLGLLDRTLDRVLALGHPSPDTGALVLAGADHPVHGLGVSAYPASVTAEVMGAAVAGDACGVVAARTAGLRAVVVDCGVTGGPVEGAVDARPAGSRGDLATGDALEASDVARLVERGRETGRSAARCGLVALGEVGVGNTTVASILVAALLERDVGETVGVGAAADAAMVQRKVEVGRAALVRARRAHGDALDDPFVLLGSLGGPEFAVLAGVTLGAAGAGAAVVMDGLATTVAAALAVRAEPAVAAHLVAGQRSREPAHALLLDDLGLEPLLDLRIRAGEGVGACLAARMLRDALAIRRLTARTRG